MAVLVPGKFIYLATPHTASIATTQALAQQLDGAIASEINELKDFDHLLPRNTHHATHQTVRKISPELFHGNEVAITTIRHPCDLIVTWWLRQRDVIAKSLGREISFAEFVRTCDETTPGPYIKNGKIFWQDFDSYLRYETLQSDLDAFLIGLALPTVTLKPANVTGNKRDWPTYYNDEITTVVIERFGEEARNFGYDLTSK